MVLLYFLTSGMNFVNFNVGYGLWAGYVLLAMYVTPL